MPNRPILGENQRAVLSKGYVSGGPFHWEEAGGLSTPKKKQNIAGTKLRVASAFGSRIPNLQIQRAFGYTRSSSGPSTLKPIFCGILKSVVSPLKDDQGEAGAGARTLLSPTVEETKNDDHRRETQRHAGALTHMLETFCRRAAADWTTQHVKDFTERLAAFLEAQELEPQGVLNGSLMADSAGGGEPGLVWILWDIGDRFAAFLPEKGVVSYGDFIFAT